MGNVRHLRRKNRRKTIWILFLIIVILILTGVLGVSMFKQYKESKEPQYSYISMSEEAAARAFVWLSKIEDTNITYEEIKELMGEINLEVVKVPTDEKGVYETKLTDNAYDFCVSQAELGLEKAYSLCVCRRIKNSGYDGDVSDQVVEELMNETFGMSVTEYLNQCNIKLIPSEDELNEKYAGEVTDEKDK